MMHIRLFSPSAYRRDKGNGITFCYGAVVFYICFIDCDHGIVNRLKAVPFL